MIEERIARLRQFLREHTADGIVILQPENLRYFSGFTGGEGALVLTASMATLWTDSRYTEQAAGESGIWYAVKNHEGHLAQSIHDNIVDTHAQVVLYEAPYLTHAMYEQIVADLDDISFEGADITILRAIKEPRELEATRKASDIADRAFAELMADIRPGVTEKNWQQSLKVKCCS